MVKKPSRILVMDDDAAECAQLFQLLNLLGYIAECALTCADAEHSLEQRAFEAVILADEVADGHAGAVLDWLRQQGRREPAIVVSRWADYDLLIECVNRGAVDLLARPVTRETLERALRLALAPHSAAAGA